MEFKMNTMNMTPEEYYHLLSSRTEREETFVNDINDKPPSYEEQLLLKRRLREIEQIEKMQEMEQQLQLEQMRREQLQQNLKQEQLQDLWHRQGLKQNGGFGNGSNLSSSGSAQGLNNSWRGNEPQSTAHYGPNFRSELHNTMRNEGGNRTNPNGPNGMPHTNSFSRSYTAHPPSDGREPQTSRPKKRSSHDLLTSLAPEELYDMPNNLTPQEMFEMQLLAEQQHQHQRHQQQQQHSMQSNLSRTNEMMNRSMNDERMMRVLETDRSRQCHPMSFHESMTNVKRNMAARDGEGRYRRANSDSLNPMDFLCVEDVGSNGLIDKTPFEEVLSHHQENRGERYPRSKSDPLNPMDFLDENNDSNGSLRYDAFDEFAQQNQLFCEQTSESFDVSHASLKSHHTMPERGDGKFSDGGYYRPCGSHGSGGSRSKGNNGSNGNNGNDLSGFQEEMHNSMPLLYASPTMSMNKNLSHRCSNNNDSMSYTTMGMQCKPLKRRKQDMNPSSRNKLHSFSMPISAPTIMKRSAIEKSDLIQPVDVGDAISIKDAKSEDAISPGMAAMAKYYFVDPEDDMGGDEAGSVPIGNGAGIRAGLPPPPLFNLYADGRKDKKKKSVRTDVFIPSAITLKISKLSEEIRSTFDPNGSDAPGEKEKDKDVDMDALEVPASSSDVTAAAANTGSESAPANASSMSEIPKFASAMEASQFSQQSIHDWDRRFGLRRAHSKTMRESSRSRQRILELMKEDFIDKKMSDKFNASCSNVMDSTSGSLNNSSTSLDFNASNTSLMSAPPILEKVSSTASANGNSKRPSSSPGKDDKDDIVMSIDTKTADANDDATYEDEHGSIVKKVATKKGSGNFKKKDTLSAPPSPALSLIFEDDDVSVAFSNISIVGDELDDDDDDMCMTPTNVKPSISSSVGPNPKHNPEEANDLSLSSTNFDKNYVRMKSESTNSTSNTKHSSDSSSSKMSQEFVQMFRRASIDFMEQEIGPIVPEPVKRQITARTA